jgi:hypothetical protein
LRCLIDAGKKLQRTMTRDGCETHSIVFVRNDVFELLMDAIPDFGKETRVSLDWHDDMFLKELMRRRLVYATPFEINDFEQMWNSICVSHVDAVASFHYFLERSIKRPRNLIKMFLAAKGQAINLRHNKIETEDIRKGISHYSYDILIEASREIGDIFPAAKNTLYHFIDGNEFYTKEDLESLLSKEVDSGELERLFELLLYFGFLGIVTNTQEAVFIYDVHYDMKLLRAKIEKEGSSVLYKLHEAFWPALNVE